MSTQSAGKRMRVSWLGMLLTALTAGKALAQSAAMFVPVSAACVQEQQVVMTEIPNGRDKEVELTVSAALAFADDHTQNSCAGPILSNMAVFMSVSGRYAEAERLAERAVLILEKIYSPNGLELLRPLQTLAASRLEQGKTAKAKEAFKRIQAIRIQRPEDGALVHAIAAALLHAEGNLAEAETEYLASLRAWQDASRGERADVGTILNGLGVVYIHEQRLAEARQALDRALAIFSRAKDAAPSDYIKVLQCRGALHVRQDDWREAEQDFHDALSIADQEPWVDPVVLRSLLTNYAYVLRRNHHGREARSAKARAATIHLDSAPSIDVTELLPKGKSTKK